MAQSHSLSFDNVTRKSHDFFPDTVQYQTEALVQIRLKVKPIEKEIAGRAS